MDKWCEDSEVLTLYHNAFSVLFPAWETLFADVMKAHMDSVEDLELIEAMQRFIKQEESHARAHSKHNKLHSLSSLEAEQAKKTAILAKRPKSKMLLAAMVSIEHLASTLGQDFIDRYESEQSREYRLFLWHSREEIEHKDVAFRLWKELGYSTEELRRPAWNNLRYVLGAVLSHVWDNIDLRSPKTYIDLTRLLWRLQRVIRHYSTIFTRGFNP